MGSKKYYETTSGWYNEGGYRSETPKFEMSEEESILSNLDSMAATPGNIYHDPAFRAGAIDRLVSYVIKTGTNPNKYKGKHFYAEFVVALSKAKAAAPTAKVKAPANDDPIMGNN